MKYEQTFANEHAARGAAEGIEVRDSVTKVLLYAYPWLEGLAQASEEAAKTRALLSYKRRAMDAALGVLEESRAAAALRALKSDMDELLKHFSSEEGGLFAYKYFRTRKAPNAPSERTYYRRQRRLLEKAARLFGSYGWTDERFFLEFGAYPPFVRLLRFVEQNKIPAHPSASSSGGG